ncbi:hypothetical protein ONZ45_g18473 [Pleurotus djamor]|nr:hypothetical protein ONZ45_g18473 [Pleurotus djamor]
MSPTPSTISTLSSRGATPVPSNSIPRLPNPFLVIRFVVFALLVFLNFQVLVFSAWNINAALSASYPVPGVSVFFIFNCCLLYFFLIVAMGEYMRPLTKTGQIKFELSWSGVLSLLYIGATIALTVDGPTVRCQISSDPSACASASLLMPVTWATTMTLLSYFFGLVILVAVHLPVYPEVLQSTVYKFPWFDNSGDAIVHRVSPDLEKGVIQVDVASWTKRTKTLDPPSWAAALKVRRGKDDPFARHQTTPSSSGVSTVAPSVPDKDDYYRPTAPTPKGVKSPITPSHHDSPFPAAVEDQDIPIPLPRLSSWIRADARNGITVHTIPMPSP